MKRIISLVSALVMLFAALPVYAEGISIPDSARAGEGDDCSCAITFDGRNAAASGAGAAVNEGSITINAAGSYLLRGNYNGTVIVDTQDEKKVVLCLDGMYLEGMINVISAPKNVTVKACAGSVNVIRHTGEEGAAVYAKADLRLTGEGELYAVSENGRGIYSSDDIAIDGLALFIKSADNGIHGKDSVEISGGSIKVESESDGIKATNSKNEEKGTVTISGGTVRITAEGDGIQAETTVLVSGGEVSITAGGGHTASTRTHAEDFGRGMGMGGKNGDRFRVQQQPEEQAAPQEDDSVSTKGIKAGLSVEISGGEINIDSCDDGIHSDKNVSVSGGSIVIYTGDDGVHADETLDISGGSIDVRASYEGFEGALINISGGENHVTASDDGINAAGDSETAETAPEQTTAGFGGFGGHGGFGGRGGFGGNGVGELNITGGYTVVDAMGDGLDSNNVASMSGGTVIVYGPVANNNAPIDYERSFSFTGGTLIASGSAGMAQSVSAGENTSVMAFRLSVKADELLTVTDSEGNELLAFVSPRDYASLVFAGDVLENGKTYNIYLGGIHTGEATDGVYSGGTTEGAELLGSYTAR